MKLCCGKIQRKKESQTLRDFDGKLHGYCAEQLVDLVILCLQEASSAPQGSTCGKELMIKAPRLSDDYRPGGLYSPALDASEKLKADCG